MCTKKRLPLNQSKRWESLGSATLKATNSFLTDSQQAQLAEVMQQLIKSDSKPTKQISKVPKITTVVDSIDSTDFKISTWRKAIEQSSLVATTKLVLYIIANHADREGEIEHLDTASISRACCLNSDLIRYHLADAKQSGFIKYSSTTIDCKQQNEAYSLVFPRKIATEISKDLLINQISNQQKLTNSLKTGGCAMKS